MPVSGRARKSRIDAWRYAVPSRPVHIYLRLTLLPGGFSTPGPLLVASSLAEYTCQRLPRGAYCTLVPFYTVTRAGRLNQHLSYFAASAPGYKGSFARSTGMSRDARFIPSLRLSSATDPEANGA